MVLEELLCPDITEIILGGEVLFPGCDWSNPKLP